MLAHRIIPVMLTKGRTLVKGQRFINDRVIGVAAQAARIHAARGVDELLLIDITATAEGRIPDLKLVGDLCNGNFSPITVGGGVQTVANVDALLRAGADRVLVGAAARRDLGLVRECAQHFGCQAITVAIDYPDQSIADAVHAAEAGAGEIVLNNKERDGTLEGLDIELIRHAAKALPVPLVACGGTSGYEDMRRALEAGASAVGVGALFSFCDATPLGAVKYLRSKGLEVRVP